MVYGEKIAPTMAGLDGGRVILTNTLFPINYNHMIIDIGIIGLEVFRNLYKEIIKTHKIKTKIK